MQKTRTSTKMGKDQVKIKQTEIERVGIRGVQRFVEETQAKNPPKALTAHEHPNMNSLE